MKKICSAGVMFLYLAGRMREDEVQTCQVDTYKNAFDFYERVKEIQDEETDIELFCILGMPEKVEELVDVFTNRINAQLDWQGKNFKKMLLEAQQRAVGIDFPISCSPDEEIWRMHCFVFGKLAGEEFEFLLDYMIGTWLQFEKPILSGKQIMTRTFQLADLRGRKTIDVYPDAQSGEWVLILDGGMKLRLNSDIPYMRERVGIYDVGRHTIGGIDSILINPVYAHEKVFDPTEMYEEWHKTFLYALAIQNRKWSTKELVYFYEKFLEFMEENVCDVMTAESIITKEMSYQVLGKSIEDLRDFLKGKDSRVISKDLWILLNTRYVYLPYLYELLELPIETIGISKEKFSQNELKKFIQSSEQKDIYQKGLQWENAVEYFLNCISGLQISGRRVKAISQEIDLSVVNVSLDNKLWEMGAYILVECKNWNRKVGIQVIRGLAHISELKGNKTTFLFTTTGITKDAEEEILRSALDGKYILCITKNEMVQVKNNKECYQLLIDKWNEVRARVEGELRL